jgi:hypothetical protein
MLGLFLGPKRTHLHFLSYSTSSINVDEGSIFCCRYLHLIVFETKQKRYVFVFHIYLRTVYISLSNRCKLFLSGEETNPIQDHFFDDFQKERKGFLVTFSAVKMYCIIYSTVFLQWFFMYFIQHSFICHPSDSTG